MKGAAGISIAILVLAIGLSGYRFYREAHENAHDSREMSKMRFLCAVTSSRLSEFYSTYGYYPRALAELALTTEDIRDEGATEGDMDAFDYDSTSNAFRLAWEHPRLGFELEGIGSNQYWKSSGGRSIYR